MNHRMSGIVYAQHFIAQQKAQMSGTSAYVLIK